MAMIPPGTIRRVSALRDSALPRYGAGGACVGDTWHTNIDDAKRQALYEYGEFVGDWGNIPAEVNDAVTFGLALLRSVGGHESSDK